MEMEQKEPAGDHKKRMPCFFRKYARLYFRERKCVGEAGVSETNALSVLAEYYRIILFQGHRVKVMEISSQVSQLV